MLLCLKSLLGLLGENRRALHRLSILTCLKTQYMKSKFSFFVFLLVFIGFFVIVEKSEASVLISQTNNNDNFISLNGTSQSFTGVAGTIEKIFLTASSTAQQTLIAYDFYLQGQGSFKIYNTADCVGTYAGIFQNLTTTKTTYELSVLSYKNLAGQCIQGGFPMSLGAYYILDVSTFYVDNPTTIYGTNTDEYTGGFCGEYNNPVLVCGNLLDIYFRFETAPVNFITALYPPAGGNIQDFANWSVNFGTITDNSGTIKIKYKIYGAPDWQFTDESGFVSFAGQSYDFNVPKSQTFAFNQSYVWQAFLYDNQNNLLAQAQTEDFIISQTGFYVNDYYTSPPTSENTGLTITCDSTSNAFSYSLCKLAIYLFVPHTASVQQFGNLKTELENKPPFGYFTATADLLGDIQTGTSTLTIYSFSAFDTLRSGLNYLLYFLILFYIVRRMRSLPI